MGIIQHLLKKNITKKWIFHYRYWHIPIDLSINSNDTHWPAQYLIRDSFWVTSICHPTSMSTVSLKWAEKMCGWFWAMKWMVFVTVTNISGSKRKERRTFRVEWEFLRFCTYTYIITVWNSTIWLFTTGSVREAILTICHHIKGWTWPSLTSIFFLNFF